MDLEWKNVEELPMDEASYKKVLLLTEGRFSGSTSLHVVTDYWHVFLDDRDYDLNVYDKKKKLSENKFSYGRLGERKVPFNKIKGWMFADKLIQLYHG